MASQVSTVSAGRSVAMATLNADISGSGLSAVIAGDFGKVTDYMAVSLSGGHAIAGTDETLAHGTPTGGAANNVTAIGFRGVVPKPARTVVTLADVILALQEQGLAL
jgi:hypothetical protein